MKDRRRVFRNLVGLAVAAAFAILPVSRVMAAEKITVFAAASLKGTLDVISTAWKTDTGNEATLSYAGSSALARQIEEGAPADVFISADVDWMTRLSEEGLIAEGSVVQLLGNHLVLIGSADSKLVVKLERNVYLAGLLGEGRLAMADVKSVPAGKYGRAALEYLGVWASVEQKVAQAENVRAALKLVTTGEAPLGIVYLTDAKEEPGVQILATFPEASHPPIVYPVGVVASSTKQAAGAFVKYLGEAKAQSIFEERGFTILKLK